jgi:hypothetical protein
VPDSEPPPSGQRAQLLGLGLLVALLSFSVWMRVHFAFGDRNFDVHDARGMLRADPALLSYATQRIVDAHGGLPPDLRADPRIEHPQTTDWLELETAGQEFVVAWARLLLAPEAPLHVVATWTMALFASLCGLGVYGLAWELTRRVRWAVLAAATWAVLPASYRTIGFILVREDFSLCWFALHLWLFARALRLRTPVSALLATAALGLFVSTWHAASFVFALEALLVLLWYLRTGQNPLASRRAACCVALLVAGTLCSPALRARTFALSPGMLAVFVLLAGALLERRTAAPARTRLLRAAGIGLVLLLGAKLATGGSGDYSHVYELLRAKLVHLGQRPADPAELSFEARLLWVGPFRTGELDDLRYGYPLGVLAILCCCPRLVRGWLRGSDDGRVQVLAALGACGVVLAMAVQRLFVLPALVAPVLAVLVAARVRWGALLLGAGILAELSFLAFFYSQFFIFWYRPDGRVDEQRKLMDWISREVPAGEAIASDYENSAAILAATGHPIILQPKYETRRSRERIEEVYTAIFRSPPEALRRLLRERYRCRWLLVDRFVLRVGMAYTGGLADAAVPNPQSAFGHLQSEDPQVFARIPGYTLVYRSEPRPGLPELYRLYRLD